MTNRHAFQDIYNMHHEKMRRYLARLIGESDADDVTQEVFMKVNDALGSFREESSLSTWIYRIATNAATDHLRRSMVSSTVHVFDDSEDDTLADQDTPLPDNQVIRKEMNDCIRSIADKLPENYRAVLILSDFEELTNSQIAEVLGISLETVKIRLHRARTRLKKELEHHCSFYRDDRNELACYRRVLPIGIVKK